MKVAILTRSTHAVPRLGGEARILHLAKALASKGNEVRLFGSRFEQGSMSPRVSQEKSFKDWSGGDWYPLSPKNGLVLVRNGPNLIRQSRELGRFDAVISELGSAWQALFSKPFVRLPMFLDEHNVEWDLMRQESISSGTRRDWKRLRAYERFCHSSFDHVLTVSDADKRAFEADGTPRRKLTVVPNGVDTVAFRPERELGSKVRRDLGLNESEFLLMYMGSLKFFPNVDAVGSILKSIYPRTRMKIPDVRLMFTGPGSEKLPAPASQGIVTTGVVDRSSLPAYINAADICLAPLKFGSGTRLKILEWMACGKAIIATKKAAEGIEVTNGENIIIEDDLDEYPRLILGLHDDQRLRMKMGENARFLAVGYYGWEKCIAPLENILKEL